MELCERCKRLDICCLPPAFDLSDPGTDDPAPLTTLRQIFEGVALACPFCRLLELRFRRSTQAEPYLTETGPVEDLAETTVSFYREILEWKVRPVRVLPTKFGGIHVVGPGKLKFEIPIYAEKDRLLLTSKLGSPASLSGDIVESDLPIALDPHAPRPSHFVRKRLDICISQHHDCRTSFSGNDVEQQGTSVAPRRLLHVVPARGENLPSQIRLVEIEKNSGFAVQYAALSHCWGPPEKRPPCTLKGNLDHHKEGIPWTKLSQTFRDACALCSDLGIEYLWIDSLCIVQDDATDWKTEAAIMGRTYEEALLVIAASAATDSSQGLFGVRLPDDVAPMPYKGDVRSGVCAYNARSPNHLIDNGPLNSRAWVLQEYVLARRTVHFTRLGVVWTCSRDPAIAVSEYHFGKQTGHLIPNTWENIIRSYSKREITYKSDKLIAIQGLASSWGNKHGKTPHYGLFLEDMPLCLAWFWSGHGDDKLVRDVEGAPSWSWASVTGSLDFLMRENEEATPGMRTLCGRIRPHDQSESPGALLFESSLVKGVDAIAGPFDCLPSYLEDLQAIDAESETLRHLVPGSTSWCSHSNHYEQYYMLVDQQRGNVGWCAFDERKQTAGPISCLPLFKESATPWYMPPVDTAEPFYLWCLFARQVNPEGCGRAVYQRVGWGRILAPAWIEDDQRQDVLLI